MSDQSQPPSNGPVPTEAPVRQSVREVAEAAWDEVVESPEGDDLPSQESEDGQDGRARDRLGRFVKQGEAEQPDALSPSDDPNKAPNAQQQPDPARPPESNQAPQHWSAQDRETFAKIDPAGQEFLLRRHSEMERDYQQKAQASASAVQFASAVVPIFQDPVIAGSLQQAGVAPLNAIEQWAMFHRRAMDPNPQVRMALWQELGQRMQLDPAALGQMSQPGNAALSEADLKDPAIRYFADHIGKTTNAVQELQNALDQMRHQDTERQQAEATKAARWQIDTFADERGADGKPLRPDFDKVLPAMIEMFKAHPEMDIRQCYEEARWRTPEVRQGLISAQQQQAAQRQASERAKLAVRGNVRGMTSPVSKPAEARQGKRSLRDTLEESADEVGFSG